MKNMFKLVFITVLSGVLLSACSATHTVKEPTRSALELQQIQTREFEASHKVTFASVLSVLQDTGYIVESADTDTGFITAKSPSKSNTTYDLFWGLGKRHRATMVTAFVEPVGDSYSRVRLNFVGIENNNKMYGISSQVDTPIEDETIYKNVFDKIDETIFIRLSLETPKGIPASEVANQTAAESAAGVESSAGAASADGEAPVAETPAAETPATETAPVEQSEPAPAGQ